VVDPIDTDIDKKYGRGYNYIKMKVRLITCKIASKKMKSVYVIIFGLIIGVLITNFVPTLFTRSSNLHECRFWGIVFSGQGSHLEYIIRTQLDSLRLLGNNNPDGWGIGYYLSPDSGSRLPIISRGEPMAPLDPRYNRIVGEMINYCRGAGIAHVRRGTSGPRIGIPNPHPFRRSCVYRNFDMILAHNGSISTHHLLDLIYSVNSVYLALNPPDYNPEYLDSDLLSIFIAEMIDSYLDSTIESCIRMAVIKLDSTLGSLLAQFNFVMTDGSTMWALRFAEAIPKGFTLYYYPDVAISNIWVVASEPLDTFVNFWKAVPNSTLVILKPYQPPRFTSIYGYFGEDSRDEIVDGLEIVQPNPFSKEAKITYWVSIESEVKLMIYNEAGCFVRKLFEGVQIPGFYTIIWDGKDNEGKDVANGVYFCKIKRGNTWDNRKMVLIR